MSTKVTVAGMINDPMFHKSVTIARQLESLHPEQVQVECLQFFESQWSQFLKKTSNDLKGVFYNHKDSSALIYLNGKDYIGDADQFTQWALYNFQYMDQDGLNVYNKMAAQTYTEAINNSNTRRYATMNISHSGVSGDVVFELFSDIAPSTCENFIGLCQGFKRSSDGEQIGYEGTEVHRIVPGMYLQAGRIRSGETNTSLHGGEFSDESFHVKHTEIGLLGMCKRSGLKHSNESQFYITTGAPLTFLDNENVVFGRVISGMHFIESIEKLDTVNEKSANGPVKIGASGVFRAKE